MIKRFCLPLFLLLISSQASAASLPVTGATCHGRFPNPITDICWSCMFPISIGGFPVVNSDKPDPATGGAPNLYLPNPYPPYIRVGITIAFWEPVRLVDVTRTPGCMVNLGGVPMGLNSVGAGQGVRPIDSDDSANYQVHWYIYPVTYLLSAIVDTLCLETQGFDMAYMTEIDPLWQDDELSFLLNPEAVLFNNPVAIAACAADCAASTAGLPLDPLFWCLGCPRYGLPNERYYCRSTWGNNGFTDDG